MVVVREPDRVLELQDLAGQIVKKRAEGAPQPEIDDLVKEYQKLRRAV